jgi:FkbM family methyltransferase
MQTQTQMLARLLAAFGLAKEPHAELSYGPTLTARVQRGREALFLGNGGADPPEMPHGAPVDLLSPLLLGLGKLHLYSPEVAFSKLVVPRIPPRDRAKTLVVDVGANNGQFALTVAREGLRGMCFEPSPRVCRALQRRVDAFQNGGGRPPARLWALGRALGRASPATPIKVHCAAVGEKRGTVTLRETVNASASSSVVAGGGGDGGVVVPVLRLDDMVGDNERGLVLKTDTQGFEAGVLRGASALLERKAARLLIVELSDGLLRLHGSSALELMQLIATYGYHCTFLRFFRLRRSRDEGGAGARGMGRGRRHRPQRTARQREQWVPMNEIPSRLANQSVVPFARMVQTLRELRAWTDLLCWA